MDDRVWAEFRAEFDKFLDGLSVDGRMKLVLGFYRWLWRRGQ